MGGRAASELLLRSPTGSSFVRAYLQILSERSQDAIYFLAGRAGGSGGRSQSPPADCLISSPPPGRWVLPPFEHRTSPVLTVWDPVMSSLYGSPLSLRLALRAEKVISEYHPPETLHRSAAQRSRHWFCRRANRETAF
jgi:hypothetical protein